ncbi:MAG: hypothetical protein ACP5QO_07490 [Clostridia bacterium]
MGSTGSRSATFMPGQIIGDEAPCEWVSWTAAAQHFASFGGRTQSQAHIKPLHWYTACRLVVEGGFFPEEVMPHPPFRVDRHNRLIYDPSVARWSEGTIFGGLKTKNVDVTVFKPRVGPVMAVSHKGVTGAFRNLTNRMEETIGECTNLHMAYPALVVGYFVVLRGSRTGTHPNDIGIDVNGNVVDGIARFSQALTRLANRAHFRDDPTRYEAISLAVVETSGNIGAVVPTFPALGSPLRMGDFFPRLYDQYDQRFVYGAPALVSRTRRGEWAPDSPAWQSAPSALDYQPRTTP